MRCPLQPQCLKQPLFSAVASGGVPSEKQRRAAYDIGPIHRELNKAAASNTASFESYYKMVPWDVPGHSSCHRLESLFDSSFAPAKHHSFLEETPRFRNVEGTGMFTSAEPLRGQNMELSPEQRLSKSAQDAPPLPCGRLTKPPTGPKKATRLTRRGHRRQIPHKPAQRRALPSPHREDPGKTPTCATQPPPPFLRSRSHIATETHPPYQSIQSARPSDAKRRPFTFVRRYSTDATRFLLAHDPRVTSVYARSSTLTGPAGMEEAMP